MASWTPVAREADLAVGEMRGCPGLPVPVVLFRLEDGFHALQDLCPHGNARLSDGFVDGDCVECPLHQGLIDIRTGGPRAAPIASPTPRYEVRVEDGVVSVLLPGPAAT